jgi:hypothetical protein
MKTRIESEVKRMSYADWLAEAERRFGKNSMKWKFICPACGFVASTEDYKRAGAKPENVGFSCIGRWTGHIETDMGTKPGPCNYAGGGLIGLNPITVVMPDGKEHDVFDFAEVESVAQKAD